jgi:hypothetical protein
LQQAAADGERLLINVNVSEASYDPKTGDFDASKLTATYSNLSGKTYNTLQADLPEGEAFSALTGKLGEAFQKSAASVMNSVPALKNLSSSLSEEKIREIAGDQPVSGSSQLQILIDQQGNPDAIVFKGGLSRGGESVMNTFGQINAERIEQVAAARGIDYDGGQLLDNLVDGKFDITSAAGFAGVAEGGQLGISASIAEDRQISGQAYLADPSAQSLNDSMLYTEVKMNPAAAAPESGMAQMSNIANGIISNYLGQNIEIEGIDEILGNPTGDITFVADGIHLAKDGFSAEKGSLTADFNNVGSLPATLAKNLDLAGKIEDKMSEYIKDPSVDINLSTAPAP